MNDKPELTRFLEAQNKLYLNALSEIKRGKKQSHWMWFIFPQLKGLGRSGTAQFYGIRDIEEASAYLAHPVLGKHLTEICDELLRLEGLCAHDIFGSPDDVKLRSSVTLFSQVENSGPVFQKVLDKYFQGKPDPKTLQLLES